MQKIHEESEIPGKILIFAQTKRGVDHVARFIQSFGVRCCAIHGDKSQTDRDSTLKAFRSGRVNILVVNNQFWKGEEDIKNLFSINRLQMWLLEG